MFHCLSCSAFDDVDTPSAQVSASSRPAQISADTSTRPSTYADLSIPRRPSQPVLPSTEKHYKDSLPQQPQPGRLIKAWRDFKDATPTFKFDYATIKARERDQLRQDSVSWPTESMYRRPRRGRAKVRESWATFLSGDSERIFRLGPVRFTWRGLLPSNTVSSSQSMPESPLDCSPRNASGSPSADLPLEQWPRHNASSGDHSGKALKHVSSLGQLKPEGASLTHPPKIKKAPAKGSLKPSPAVKANLHRKVTWGSIIRFGILADEPPVKRSDQTAPTQRSRLISNESDAERPSIRVVA